MPQSEVVDAVERRLDALWHEPEAILARAAMNLPGCQIFGTNLQGNVPDDGTEFAQVQYPVANVKQMDLAARHYREEGAIRVIVMAQSGEGVKVGLQLCGLLAGLLRSKKFDGVQTWVPTSPVIDDGNDDGLYFRLPFIVPYHFYFTDDAGFYA